MGVTSDQRVEILKNRAAPIQIVWCGFCNSTGIEEVDYIISDPNLIYDSELNLYQEKIIMHFQWILMTSYILDFL